MKQNITTPELFCQAKLDELEGKLQSRLGNRVRELRLIQSGAGLILRGWSATYYGKQLAQHAVLEATNLPLIANEIEVIAPEVKPWERGQHRTAETRKYPAD